MGSSRNAINRWRRSVCLVYSGLGTNILTQRHRDIEPKLSSWRRGSAVAAGTATGTDPNDNGEDDQEGTDTSDSLLVDAGLLDELDHTGSRGPVGCGMYVSSVEPRNCPRGSCAGSSVDWILTPHSWQNLASSGLSWPSMHFMIFPIA
jgi:hypothetical protein